MRITNTFVSIFLVTFLIGYVSVLPVKKVSGPEKLEKNGAPFKMENIFLEEFSKPKAGRKDVQTKIEMPVDAEILEENNDWQNDSEIEAELVETGEGFHGDEIEAKSGETWIGLFKENNNYFLRSTKIEVTRVEDSIVDDAGEKTGKSVAVKGKAKPLFLVKNAKMLRKGRVAKLYDGNYYEDQTLDEDSEKLRSLRIGFTRQFEMNGTTYTLRVKKGVNKNQQPIVALILESEGKSQTLHSLESFGADDYLGELNWVGDLDGDTKPDFYFDLYFNDNVEYKNLFLSTKPKKGKLVKKVATFIITGC